jgi:hypothetical protein
MSPPSLHQVPNQINTFVAICCHQLLRPSRLALKQHEYYVLCSNQCRLAPDYHRPKRGTQNPPAFHPAPRVCTAARVPAGPPSPTAASNRGAGDDNTPVCSAEKILCMPRIPSRIRSECLGPGWVDGMDELNHQQTLDKMAMQSPEKTIPLYTMVAPNTQASKLH